MDFFFLSSGGKAIVVSLEFREGILRGEIEKGERERG